MKARLFVEVNSATDIVECENRLGSQYVLVYVFSISDNPNMFSMCVAHKFPVCPTIHVMSDGQILKRFNHNIFFNLCDEYIPHILLHRTIVKVDSIDKIDVLRSNPFHSYLWLGDDGEIPRVQTHYDIPLIRTINSLSDKIGLYGIDSYWLNIENIGLFN